MFNKLRLKLTLINVSIILTLFILLLSCTYILYDYGITQGSYHIMERISLQLKSGERTEIPAPRKQKTPTIPGFLPPPHPYFFFMKLTASGQIFETSSPLPLERKQLPDFLKEITDRQEKNGKFTFQGTDFIYVITPLENGQTLVLCNDLTQQNDILASQLAILLGVGFLCALLSFAASYILAAHAIRPIRRAHDQQKHFVSDASHELRTPLAILQTNLDILKSAPEKESIAENRKWIDNIQEETSRMTHLINDLLFLARADANQQDMKREPLDLAIVILQVQSSFEVLAAQKQVLLSVKLIPDAIVNGDASRLLQTLTILLDNALRHTETGGQVEIRLKRTPGKLSLEVMDSGEGIPPEHLPKIFERFYQVDASRHKGGAGLGLSLAKWIITQHGGTISISSLPQKGTTVTIVLPSIQINTDNHPPQIF